MTPPDEPLEQGGDLRSDIVKAFEADSVAQDGGEAVQQQPVAQPEAQAPAPAAAVERARDAQGRFITQPDVAAAATDATKAAAVAAQPQQQQQVQQPAAPVQGPPPGWSAQSKSLYAGLPDAIKADIAKRETEMSQGLAKLAEYKNLDPYVEMARNSRTTLHEALARYVKAEQTLETDPTSGLLWLANNYKVDPAQLMYGLCRMYNIHPLQLVQAIGGDMPPHQQGQPQPPSNQTDPRTAQQLQAMNERLQFMEREREQVENQSINGQISAFAADPANRFFENVRHRMAHIIRTSPPEANLTLKQVYEDACWADPEVRAVLINEQRTPQTSKPTPPAINGRASRGSLPTGSPLPGGTLTRNEPASSLREEIQRAYEEHR